MDLDRIEALLRLLRRQERINEVRVEGEGWSLRARRLPGAPPPVPDLGAPTEAAPRRVSVRSDRVGFYRAPVEPLLPGAHLDRSTVVGAIDSMGILNPITTETGGQLLEVRVVDGEPVEYGQELLVLCPDGAARSEDSARGAGP